MAFFFDTNYSDWFHRLETAENIADLLIEFDQYTSRLLEDSPYRSFLPQLYGYEVMSSGERYILSEKTSLLSPAPFFLSGRANARRVVYQIFR